MLPQTKRAIISGFDSVEILIFAAGILAVVAIAMVF